MIMPPDDRLARMACLVQVLVRRKPIAAVFTASGSAPATLSDAPHTAAISNPSTHNALPWQRIGDILFAEIPDPNGVNAKVRRLVVQKITPRLAWRSLGEKALRKSSDTFGVRGADALGRCASPTS